MLIEGQIETEHKNESMAKGGALSQTRWKPFIHVSTPDWPPRSGCPGNRWPRVRDMTTSFGQLWFAPFLCGWMMTVCVNGVWVTDHVDLAALWRGRGSWDAARSWHHLMWTPGTSTRAHHCAGGLCANCHSQHKSAEGHRRLAGNAKFPAKHL